MPSSGAGGPCCHCGRTNSCCWRRGPANKPVLCNACGSRYLVKRNLDNYVPLATRQGKEGAGKEAGRRAPQTAAGRVSKPKRAAVQKRVDSDAWNSDREDSEASDTSNGLTDDSAASAGAVQRAAQHAAALLSQEPAHASKLIHITSQMQLKELGSADFSSLAGALFASSMRLKPRKPLVVTVSAVW